MYVMLAAMPGIPATFGPDMIRKFEAKTLGNSMRRTMVGESRYREIVFSNGFEKEGTLLTYNYACYFNLMP